MSDVGIVWNDNQVDHLIEDHPERPERVTTTLALLRDSGLLERLTHLDSRAASDDEIAQAHDRALVDALERACTAGGGWADMDTYIRPGSCDAMRHAAGAAIEAVEAVLSGRTRTAFSLGRPPGHHARPNQAMGFCLLNNVAIAACFALERHGLERIAILDIDVHHGNGTQDIFYKDPRVLYCSTHQYPFYPGTGRLEDTGEGTGEGATLNVPLPAGCGDAEYAMAFEHAIEPALRRYAPELILVSCGFDAHFTDPLAGMALSVTGYGEIASRMKALAGDLCTGRLVYVLEGGYDLTAVSWGVRRVLEALLGGEPTPDPHGTLAERRTVHIEDVLRQVRAVHGLEES